MMLKSRWIGRLRGWAVMLPLLAAFALVSAGSAAAGSRLLQPDREFGQEGVVRASFGPTTPFSVAVDSRGRILVASENDPRAVRELGLTVLRFLPDGRLDRSFGHAGLARFDRITDAAGLVPDRSGGTYVLGASIEEEEWVTHLGSDGTPDLGFGTRGFVRMPLFPEGLQEFVINHPLVVLPGGGLVVAGRSLERQQIKGSVELRRFSPQGHLIRDFGHDGVLVLDDPRLRHLVMTDLASTADGGILVSGSVPKPERGSAAGGVVPELRRLAVVKLGPRGGMDRRFGHGGIATPPIPYETSAHVVVGNTDGSVLVAAQHAFPNPELPEYFERRPLLLRLGRDGAIVQRFQGTPTTGEAPGYEAAAHAHLMSDLIVSGGHVFVISKEAESLLGYSLGGKCEGYLSVSPPFTESIAAATPVGHRLIVAALRRRDLDEFAPGFTLRAFRVR